MLKKKKTKTHFVILLKLFLKQNILYIMLQLVAESLVQLSIFKYVMIIPSIFSTEFKTSVYLLTY